MKYEIMAHLPQQLENLYNAFAQGDAALLDRVLDNIKDIVKDEAFQADLKDYDKERKEQFEKIQKKALESIKTLTEAKDINEVYIDLKEIQDDFTTALNSMEGEYWDKTKEYISKWADQLNVEEPK